MGRPTEDPRVRFSRFICEAIDGCWLWTGSTFPDGYGQFKIGPHNMRAHRVAWAFEHGEIPTNIMVLHRCNQPACVRASHLYLGDHAQNMTDRLAAGHYGRGTSSPVAVLDAETVRAIRERAPTNCRKIAADLGLKKSTVWNVLAGKTYAEVV